MRQLRSTAPLVILVLAVLTAAAPPPATPAPSASPRPPVVLVTGANRGLGLEFARQFAAAGAVVVGTARRPDEATELRDLGVRVESLDVTKPESVAGLAARLGDQPIDILINNAGVGNRMQSLAEIDPDVVEQVLQVNYLGPLRVTQALLPALRRGDRKLVVNISSRLGSLELNERGGYHGYRESKAALNMFTRTLAAEFRDEGFTSIAISPGWVRTSMGGSSAPLSPAESIRGMISVIDGLTAADSGGYFSHTGERLPW